MDNGQRRCSTRLARQPGKQRARSLVGDQTMNEKSNTPGRNSQSDDVEESLNEETQRGSLTEATSVNNNKTKRQKWTREEYKSVITAYYQAIEHPTESSNTKETYKIWRTNNPTIRLYMNENKLANVRRDIINKKRIIRGGA